jgi:MHS family alpha-ketoglutarate permease-like MFS transporter
MAGRRRRGFWSGFLYVTLIGGQLLAMSLQVLLQAVLGEAELAAWGWRIPFFIGGLLAVGVSWLRRTLHETPAFARSAAQERGRVGLLFGRYLRETATVVALTAGGGVGFYTYTTYMQKLLVNSAGLPAPVVSQLMVAVLASFLVLPPLAGALADRVGHKRTLVGSFVGGALVAVPTLTALSSVEDPWVAYALCLVPLVFLSGYTALSAILKAELYPAEVRALGVAVPYALAMALFGGNAESAALALKEAGHETAYFWLVAALMAVGSVAAVSMPDLDRHGKVEAHDDEPT